MAYYARYEPDETGVLQKVVYNCGIGFCLPFYGETAPPGTLACDGSEISREAYKELFQVLGTKAGAGDGTSTFNLPDFRGDFIRCVGGNAAELGVEQDATAIGFYCRGANASSIAVQVMNFEEEIVYMQNTNTYNYLPASYSPSSDFEARAVRPVNVALLWCIIYE